MEILFKGKCKETEEWLISKSIKQTDCSEIYLLSDKWVEIIPETLGLYTNFKDKNGEKIFTGDIVCGYGSKDWHKGVVTYDDVLGTFYIDTSKFEPSQYNYNTDNMLGDWKISGNIYDRHPDLKEETYD